MMLISKSKKINLLIYSRYNEFLQLQKDFDASDLKNVVQGLAQAQESLCAYFAKMNAKEELLLSSCNSKTIYKNDISCNL